MLTLKDLHPREQVINPSKKELAKRALGTKHLLHPQSTLEYAPSDKGSPILEQFRQEREREREAEQAALRG